MIRRTALVAAALLVAATVLAVGSASPATAAACTGSTGVTVVVDFNGLGGGVQGACVPDGGGDYADDLFRSAGFSVNDQAPRNPGYVCQVSDKPDGCGPPDGDAYWGLWTSTGNGSWTYATRGAGSLTVPDGGFVSFAWDDVAGDERPSYTPARQEQAPSPAPTPTPGPTQQPTRTPSAPAQPTDEPTTASPSSGATPEATTDATPDVPTTTAPPSPSQSPTAATPAPSDAPTTAAPSEAETVLAEPTEPTSGDAAADDASSLPGWMAPLIIVLLLAIAGVAALLKRRQTP